MTLQPIYVHLLFSKLKNKRTSWFYSCYYKTSLLNDVSFFNHLQIYKKHFDKHIKVRACLKFIRKQRYKNNINKYFIN